VQECPEFTEYREAGSVPLAFESGTGGYGYNLAYVGSTLYLDGSVRNTTQDSRVRKPSDTIMFADAALPMNGYIVEYSFLEPPHFVSPEFPEGRAEWGYSSPTMHFRHNGRANVLWCDGHITSEAWGWGPVTNMYGGNNRRHAVGWFGPRDNRLFDVRSKADYAPEPPADASPVS
jgi:prepilin-type processing-associated H-X9-DG protein